MADHELRCVVASRTVVESAPTTCVKGLAPMRISRKTGILISSVTVTAMAFGTVGAAAAVTADPPARPAAQAPAPDPAVVLNQLSNLGAVGKVVESLRAAMTDKQDPARVTRLVNQAKRQLNDIAATARSTRSGRIAKSRKGVRHTASGKAVDPTPSAAGAAADATDALIAKAVNQLEAELNSVVKAVDANDPTKILDAVNAALLSTVNVVSAVLTASGLPSASVPGLGQTSGLPSTATVAPAASGAATAPARPNAPSAPNTKPSAPVAAGSSGGSAHN